MTQTSFARGVNRLHTIARESTPNVAASAGGGRVLRRVSASPNFSADAFRSNEITQSQQIRDARLGTQRGNIAYQGQLAPGAQYEFFEHMLRRDFTVGASVALTGLTAASGPPGTFTRASGSWITDGFRIGDVVRMTGWTTTGAANNARNYRISALTATVMTVTGTGKEVVAAKASETGSVTVALPGKKTWIPLTGHLFNSFTWEDWSPDTVPAACDLYVGCRVQSIRINMGPTGIITIDVQILAKDMQTYTVRWFTSPAPQTTDNSLSSPTGTVRLNGLDVAVLTGLQLSISTPIEANPSVGSRTVAEVFQGPLMIEGSANVYFTDTDMRENFRNEVEGELYTYFPSDGTLNSAFIAMSMPRLKMLSASRSDGPMSIMQTLSFQGLESIVAGVSAYERTSFSIQDSVLV